MPKGQRQQPTVHLCLHWYAHRPLTLACDISLQTSWIDLVKRCGCFFLLDSRYSPLAEVMPVYILSEYCSNLPLKNRPMRYFRLLVRVSLLTLFLRYYADILSKFFSLSSVHIEIKYSVQMFVWSCVKDTRFCLTENH